jgi:alkanesulfonate monooxygenase SsuD/methylene tetrahydromethanopterin reductase-like flavin-dependent oxidoreductase (luciferase family)
MFFAHDAGSGTGRYDMLLSAAKLADEEGLVCVWTPERHFDRFGGAYANPAVTSAALAVHTQRIQLRAGSVVSPLHDPSVSRKSGPWSITSLAVVWLYRLRLAGRE